MEFRKQHPDMEVSGMKNGNSIITGFDKINQNGEICIDGLISLPAADVAEEEDILKFYDKRSSNICS